MKHVSQQMTLSVEEAANYAVDSPSATEAEFLHIGAAAGFYGGAYRAGGAYSAGAAYQSRGALATGSHENSTEVFAGGHIGGGYQAGYKSRADTLNRSANELSSISTSVTSQTHSESSSIHAASAATKTASAAAVQVVTATS